MIDISDLRDAEVCEKCNLIFMPTKDELKSYCRTKYCKFCNNEETSQKQRKEKFA